jgi:hypothetical protein
MSVRLCDNGPSFNANAWGRPLSSRDFNGTTTDQLATAVSLAGLFVRYSFYLFGALVMGIIAFALLWGWNHRVKVVADAPAFRITDGSVGRLPVTTEVITGGRQGRLEVVQYGTLHNRGTDLAVVMVLPPKGALGSTRIAMDLRETNLLRHARAYNLSVHYDLETRYGPIHAVEMRAETDGRWKQCLSYSSRFDTNAVALAGWTCDATGSKPGADALACALDKLVIDRPLATAEADGYMRERMKKPANCSASIVSQTIDVRSRGISPPSRWSQPSSRTRL